MESEEITISRQELWDELEEVLESLEIGAFTDDQHEAGLHARKWELLKLLQDEEGILNFNI